MVSSLFSIHKRVLSTPSNVVRNFNTMPDDGQITDLNLIQSQNKHILIINLSN